MAVNGVIGTWAGPSESGTAYVMAHHSIGDIGDGDLGNWGFQEGGMGGVADAIERSQGSVRKYTECASRESEHRRPQGPRRGAAVRREISAPIVVTTLHPRTAFLDHLDRGELPDTFVQDIERWKRGVAWSRSTWPCPSCRTSSPIPAPISKSTTQVRWRWHRPWSTSNAPFQDATEGRTGSAALSVTASSPAPPRQDIVPGGYTYHVAVLPVGAAGASPESAAPQRSSRPTQTAWWTATTETAPNFKSFPHIHRDVVGPLRDGARLRVRSGGTSSTASSRPSSSSTCGPPRIRRLPHTGAWPLLRELGHARRRRGLRHPRVAGGTSCHPRPPARPTPALAWRRPRAGGDRTLGAGLGAGCPEPARRRRRGPRHAQGKVGCARGCEPEARQLGGAHGHGGDPQ